MRLTLIFSFFIFLNFMLILLPKMMPNVISLEQTLFWVFWVNGLFVLTLILPAKSSYIFESMSKAKLVTEAISEQFFGKKEPKGDEAKSVNKTLAADNQGAHTPTSPMTNADGRDDAIARINKRRAAGKGKEGGKSEGSSGLNKEVRYTREQANDMINKEREGQVGGGKVMKGGDKIEECLSPMMKAFIKEGIIDKLPN